MDVEREVAIATAEMNAEVDEKRRRQKAAEIMADAEVAGDTLSHSLPRARLCFNCFSHHVPAIPLAAEKLLLAAEMASVRAQLEKEELSSMINQVRDLSDLQTARVRRVFKRSRPINSWFPAGRGPHRVGQGRCRRSGGGGCSSVAVRPALRQQRGGLGVGLGAPCSAGFLRPIWRHI